jgi:hypothetical protein
MIFIKKKSNQTGSNRSVSVRFDSIIFEKTGLAQFFPVWVRFSSIVSVLGL